MSTAADAGADTAAAVAVSPFDGTAERARTRFLMELEFVQCLANPFYLHHLAQNRFFDDDAMLAYLEYLQYWRQPQYARFIIFPQCLGFLERLQQPAFRAELAKAEFAEFLHQQQFFHWQHYRANRVQQQQQQREQEAAAQEQASATTEAAAAVATDTPAAAGVTTAATTSV